MTGIHYRSFITSSDRVKALTKRLRTNAGRNHRGVITVRHQGGGAKKIYRMVDFNQNRMNIPARVEAIEYDPYRSSFIARIIYRDGMRSYILAAKDMKVDDELVSAENPALKTGNRMPLKNVPVGYFVHNVELKVGGGGRIARSAGSYAEVLAQEGGTTTLRLASKEVRLVSSAGLATLGQVSNPDYNLTNLGKAGRSRWLGVRPTVRGSVMNPVDLPYVGCEVKQPRGTKRPKTRWGKITGGRKTRNRKKWAGKFILERRPKVR